MAQPPAYTQNHDYGDFSASYPSTPHNGLWLDEEFAEIVTVLNAIRTNLALIQRDDGEVANNSIGIDQLADEITFGFNAPTDWVTATAYALRDSVWNSNKLYRCEGAHTSGTFATDLAAGKWVLFADFSIPVDAAAASASAASVSASAAATSASGAATSASTASTSATAAQAAQAAAEALVASWVFDWDTGTSDADPGTGKIRVNNAALSSATKIFLSETDLYAAGVAPIVQTWDDSTSTNRAYLTLRKRSAPATFVTYAITGAITDDGSYQDIPVTHITGNGSFSAGDDVVIQVERTGNKGDAGAGSGDVVAANNGTEFTAGTFRTNLGLDYSTIFTQVKTLDGAGSGLDADLLDGAELSAIARLAVANTFTEDQTLTKATPALRVNASSGVASIYVDAPAGNSRRIQFRTGTSVRWSIFGAGNVAESGSNAGSDFSIDRYDDSGVSLGNAILITRSTGAVTIASSSVLAGGNTVWHAGNDGAGSGLDADTVDGVQLSAIPQLAVANTFTANQTIAKASAFSQLVIGQGSYDAILHLNGAAATGRYVRGSTAGLARWITWHGDTGAESGSNAGSDYAIQAYDDAGASLGVALSIKRSTQQIQAKALASVTTPDWSYITDTDTGTRRSAANTLALTGGGIDLATFAAGVVALASSATDAAAKNTTITGAQYSSAAETEGFGALVLDGANGANNVYLGGGHASYNAATTVAFYTAANETTRTGTERMRITSGGLVGIGVTPSTIFDVVGSTPIRHSDATADVTNKYGRYVGRHYTASEEDVLGLGIESITGRNTVYIGGGFAAQNAALDVRVYAGANATTVTGAEQGRFTTTKDNILEVGLSGVPVDAQDATLGWVLTDRERLKYHTTGSAYTWTIPANASVAFPIGSILFGALGPSAGNVTLAITTDTLQWGSSTGSRTIAANGAFAALKVSATVWQLYGTGIS